MVYCCMSVAVQVQQHFQDSTRVSFTLNIISVSDSSERYTPESTAPRQYLCASWGRTPRFFLGRAYGGPRGGRVKNLCHPAWSHDRRFCRLQSLGNRVASHYQNLAAVGSEATESLAMHGAIMQLDGQLLKQSSLSWQPRAVKVDNLHFGEVVRCWKCQSQGSH